MEKNNVSFGCDSTENGYKYVIPLSSPKYKKDYKIRDYQGENLPEDFLL